MYYKEVSKIYSLYYMSVLTSKKDGMFGTGVT